MLRRQMAGEVQFIHRTRWVFPNEEKKNPDTTGLDIELMMLILKFFNSFANASD